MSTLLLSNWKEWLRKSPSWVRLRYLGSPLTLRILTTLARECFPREMEFKRPIIPGLRISSTEREEIWSLIRHSATNYLMLPSLRSYTTKMKRASGNSATLAWSNCLRPMLARSLSGQLISLRSTLASLKMRSLSSTPYQSTFNLRLAGDWSLLGVFWLKENSWMD